VQWLLSTGLEVMGCVMQPLRPDRRWQ